MTNQEIRIILLGKIGSGKSQTGNNLGQLKQGFKVNPGGEPVTVECESATGERLGKQLLIIDTPGILSDKANKQYLLEIKRSVQMAKEGPHVFLLVIEMGRNVDFYKIMRRYQYLFGDNMFRYSIVLFTNFDVWKGRSSEGNDKDPDVHTYLLSLDKNAQNIFQKCCGRYAVLDNRSSGDETEGHLRDLMEKMNDLVTTNIMNNEEFYTEEENENSTEQHDSMHLMNEHSSLWKNGVYVLIFIVGISFYKYPNGLKRFSRWLLHLFHKLHLNIYAYFQNYYTKFFN